jgi:hypothetical protein
MWLSIDSFDIAAFDRLRMIGALRQAQGERGGGVRGDHHISVRAELVEAW